WRQLYGDEPPEALRRLRGSAPTAFISPMPQTTLRPSISSPPPQEQPREGVPVCAHLPRADTFYGREHELEQLWAWLVDGTTRFVTITGIGGIGKTRLALEFAHRFQACQPQPVWWVDLQGLQSAELIWNALHTALALPATHDPRSQALGYLEQTAGLLVLDNFEPLLPEGAGVVELLLSRAAQLRVLVTSRIPLRIADEQLLALMPLAIQAEQPDDLAPAVRLFADRARHVYPDFRLTPARLAEVQQLCERLDGIPLALELAAARAGVLSPQQMLERLNDRLSWLRSARRDIPARHRSLHAVLEASVAMLDDPTRDLWQRLAVLQTDFGVDTALALCTDNDTLDRLEAVVAAGLLQSEERAGVRRLRMLDTLREYAWKCLSPEAQRDAQIALLRWTLHEAEQRASQQRTTQLGDWLAFWDREREHLLHALHLAETHHLYLEAFTLLQHTQRYWMLRALHRFAETIVERILEQLPSDMQARARLLQAEWAAHAHRPRDAHAYALQAMQRFAPDASEYAWAIYYATHAAVALCDTEFLQQWGEQAARLTLNAADPMLQLAGRRMVVWYCPLPPNESMYDWFRATALQAEQLGDPLWKALTLDEWIDHCTVIGRYEEALALTEQATGAATLLQDGLRLRSLCVTQAYCRMQLGQLHVAAEWIEDALHWARLCNAEYHLELTLKANICRLRGDYETARSLFQQIEQLWGANLPAFTLEMCGVLERDMGNLPAARRTLDRALERRRAEGDRFRLHFARTHRAHVGWRLGEPDARDELEACLAFWRTQNNSPWIALTLLYLAEVYIATRAWERAHAALAEAHQRNQAIGRRVHEAIGYELQAQLATAQNDPETARQCLARASAIRHELGIPPR
ncbi:MAG: hypothetical protein RMK45_10020, partial [Armatimonadota bacterium]|nr:hypothetical protein [Armatimonadota bacterium]